MSDIIQLLPDSVANQIAAGEVIQRPGSVIKELVENSLDAGATKIDVLVVDAGKTSIQVVDNGKGMSITDARMSFERHATSKIKKASDLFSLTTMGFRGEALASIAAISCVDLKTRIKDEEMGGYIQVEGSNIIHQETVACAIGTNFTVKNLFFNVPARRKFLKSDSTELNCIVQEYERIVLVHPEISFSLRSNGVVISELPKQTERQRIIAIFGKRTNEDLLSLHSNTTLASIHGFVAQPKNSRKRRVHQYFFVNGRFMRHPYFHNAVNHAYENLIPKGEHISYFIYFKVNPESIDVNIHPTKTEIKFSEERSIWQLLSASIRESLGKFNAVPSIDFDTKDRPEIPTFTKSASAIVPHVTVNKSYNPFADDVVGKNSVGTWGSGLTTEVDSTTLSKSLDDKANQKDQIFFSRIGGKQKCIDSLKNKQKGYEHTNIIGSKLNGTIHLNVQKAKIVDETSITENRATTDYIPHFPDIIDKESSTKSDEIIKTNITSKCQIKDIESNTNFQNDKVSTNHPEVHILASSINIATPIDIREPLVNREMLINQDVSATHLFSTSTEIETQKSELSLTREGYAVHIQNSKYIRLKAGYIVVSMDNELVFIDQHRAHVRILYDRYLRQMKNHHSTSMGVLFPEILEISQSEVSLLDQIIPDLEYIGFDLASLGGGSYSINGIPPTIELSKAVELIKQAIYEVTETGKDIQTSRQESLAFTLAKNTAIHRNKKLDAEEVSLLVKQLFQTSTPKFSPSGNKVIVTLKQSEITSMFD